MSKKQFGEASMLLFAQNSLKKNYYPSSNDRVACY